MLFYSFIMRGVTAGAKWIGIISQSPKKIAFTVKLDAAAFMTAAVSPVVFYFQDNFFAFEIY